MRDIIRRHRTDPIVGKPRPESSERTKKEREVKLFTLDYDQTKEEYILSESRTTFPELPSGAVHVTGQKRTYFWDRVRAHEPDSGITAADLNLYMLNNSINDALAYHFNADKVDMRKMIIYGVGGIILVCVVWAML